MGPSKDPKSQQDYKKEDVLQAVLIADGFSSSSSSFGPLTLDHPHTLLPLASSNAALLDYSLQLLVNSGCRDIFVVSSGFSSRRVKAHVEAAAESSWIPADRRVSHVIADGATSVGDALREMDKSGLVTNDFVLITGDVVSNADLSALIQKHKERKLMDKQMAMTVVFRRDRGGSGGHRSSSAVDELLVACEAESNKILHFQRCRGKKKIDLPVDVLQSFDGDVELRYDLLDPGIAICSPIVPQIYSDDFDYLTRDDFIKGLLVHQEIMGNSVYMATIEDAYAARAFDLATYVAISQDVIGRWTYPLTPDLFPSRLNTDSSSKCRYGHGSVYRSADVVLGQNARLEANSVVGSGTKIGADCVVKNSVVGEKCVLGENVTLDGVFLMDGVSIGANSRLSRSVLASEVTLGVGVTLEPGCILGSEVKIGDGVRLPSGTELTTADEFSADGLVEELVGKCGVGYSFVREESDDEDEEDGDDAENDAAVRKLADDFWWKTKLTTTVETEASSSSSSEDDDDYDDDDIDDGDEEAEDVDAAAADGDDDDAEDEEMKDLKQFHAEVIDTLLRGVEENISSENLVLEINSLKQAYFIYISEVQQCVVKCILEAPVEKLSLSGKPLLVHVRKHGFPLLKNYVKDAEAQRLALVALAHLCCGGGSAGDQVGRRVSEVLTPFLGMLYNEDILSDSDVVFEWFAEQSVQIKKLFMPFVKNLKEAEEEEDDDDDDDDGDDEEDDEEEG